MESNFEEVEIFESWLMEGTEKTPLVGTSGQVGSTVVLPPAESKEDFEPLKLPELQDTTSTCSTDSGISCRICKCGGGPDLVPSPCHCKGSMGTVHVSCLEEWLTGSTRDSCELCSFPFNVVRTRKYGCFKSICVFLGHNVNVVRLVRDVFFLSVSLMNTSILSYMWLTYIFRDLFHYVGNKHSELEQALLSNPVKSVIYFFFFTLCLVFVAVNAVDDFRRIFHYYLMPWYNWWQASVNVKLVVDRNIEDPKNI